MLLELFDYIKEKILIGVVTMTHKYLTTLLVSMICLGYALTAGAADYHVYPKGTAVTEKNAIVGFSDWKT